MVDVHCRKCAAIVLRIDEGARARKRRRRMNVTWPNGQQIGVLDDPKCPTCGDEFRSVNAATWETLGPDDLALIEQTRGKLLN